MFDELKKYRKNGHFFFKKGNSLLEVGKKVPDRPGVYYIMRMANGKADLVYLGKSGIKTRYVNENKSQLKQSIVDQLGLVDMKMSETNIDGLDIYWFVTFDKDHHDLPEYLLGLIIQTYFDVYGRLPEWN